MSSFLTKLNPINWLAQKAALQLYQTIGGNALLRALYQYVGKDLPVWMDSNPYAYIEKGFCTNDDVYSIVNYISSKVAALPWKLYRMNGDGTMTEIKNHAILNLLERPNPYQTGKEFRKLEVAYKLVTGNTFQFAPRLENGTNAGKTKELWVMPAHLTQILFGTSDQPVGGYLVNGYWKEKLRPEDVLHRREINLMVQGASDLMGMSRLRAGSMMVGNSTEGRIANARSLKNQGPPGIITGADSENALTNEQTDAIENKYLERHSGHNSIVPIITSANLKWQAMGYPAVDLEIIESMDWSFDKLCNLYCLPSKVLNSKEASTFSNQNEAQKAAWEDAILPEAYDLRDKYNSWLCPMWGDDLWLDVDISGIGPLQEDKKELAGWLATAYWIPVVDKQRLMGITEDPKLKGVYCDMQGNALSFDPDAGSDAQVEDAAGKNAKEEVKDY